MGGREALNVIPSAHVRTRRGQAGAQPPRLEQAVLVHAHEHGLGLLELGLRASGGERDVAVVEFFQKRLSGGLLFIRSKQFGSSGEPGQRDAGGLEKFAAGGHEQMVRLTLRRSGNETHN